MINAAHLFLGFTQVFFKFLPLVRLNADCLSPFFLHLVNQSLLVHSSVCIYQKRVLEMLQLFGKRGVFLPEESRYSQSTHSETDTSLKRTLGIGPCRLNDLVILLTLTLWLLAGHETSYAIFVI